MSVLVNQLKTERLELEGAAERLKAFIEIGATSSTEYNELLTTQLKLQESYINVLTKRINILLSGEKITLAK